MRIIAGKHKGRKIEIARASPHVRPTSGFAREAIFNIISHGAYAGEHSPYLGKSVADLCSGSGAFGLEALSRGAAHVTFVDMDHHALQGARQNAETLGERDHASFVRASIASLPVAPQPYGLIFLDPPYFSNLVTACLKSLREGAWADKETLIVIEQDAREPLALPPGFILADERKYGRAVIRLLRQDASINSV
jgi:16S rRNA (guanine966-N2)-methyltransferase